MAVIRPKLGTKIQATLAGIPAIVVFLLIVLFSRDSAIAAPQQPVLTKADVLSIVNGNFYLHNRPFSEISFNKFDLFWEIYWLLDAGKADTPEYRSMVSSQDQALHELHQMGFRSIRIFAAPWANWEFRTVYDDPIKRADVFYKAMDTTLDLCDKNDIKVVYSLGAADFTDTKLVNGVWVGGVEQKRELMSDPTCRSRQYLYNYVDDIVNRYKNRKTILMWEVSNETTLNADISPDTDVYQGIRMPTLSDVAKFLDDVAHRIKLDDPLHLVNSGGSSLRASQWNQYTNHSWQTDTLTQQDQALKLLYQNSAIDVLDIHYYINNEAVNSIVTGDDGNPLPMGIKEYMDEARRLNRPVMLGEAGVSMAADDSDQNDQRIYRETPNFIDSYSNPNAAVWVKKLCDEIVTAGPQLAYIWTYSSNRSTDWTPPDFNIKKGKTDAVLAIIVQANKLLKAKYGDN